MLSSYEQSMPFYKQEVLILKSCENLVDSESEYFVYSPSKSAQNMFFYSLQCGHFIYKPGYHLRRESYDSFLLMYLQKGSMVLELEGETIPIYTNQFVLLDCYRLHAYHTIHGAECLWCHFDGITARAWYQAIVSRLSNVFSIADSYPTVRNLSFLYEMFRSGIPTREVLVSKYITDILTSFLLYTPKKSTAQPYLTMSEYVTCYISEHFCEEIPICRLAELAGLSQYHFIRTFKKETGFTPHEYLINTRMIHAKYLLKNSSLSIKDICFHTGFSCESVFCTAFKRHQGMTPLEYRSLEKISY